MKLNEKILDQKTDFAFYDASFDELLNLTSYLLPLTSYLSRARPLER